MKCCIGPSVFRYKIHIQTLSKYSKHETTIVCVYKNQNVYIYGKHVYITYIYIIFIES